MRVPVVAVSSVVSILIHLGLLYLTDLEGGATVSGGKSSTSTELSVVLQPAPPPLVVPEATMTLGEMSPVADWFVLPSEMVAEEPVPEPPEVNNEQPETSEPSAEQLGLVHYFALSELDEKPQRLFQTQLAEDLDAALKDVPTEQLMLLTGQEIAFSVQLNERGEIDDIRLRNSTLPEEISKRIEQVILDKNKGKLAYKPGMKNGVAVKSRFTFALIK